MAYNLAALRETLVAQHEDEQSFNIMQKCTKSCLLSLKENQLLPTEQKCFRNCFFKHHQFADYLKMESDY